MKFVLENANIFILLLNPGTVSFGTHSTVIWKVIFLIPGSINSFVIDLRLIILSPFSSLSQFLVS